MKILRNDVVELIRPSKGEYNEDREWVLTLSDSAPIKTAYKYTLPQNYRVLTRVRRL